MHCGKNQEAIRLFHDIGLTIVGDFIVGHDYTPDDFNALEDFILENSVDLPMLSVLTPLPGTDLYERIKKRFSSPIWIIIPLQTP